MAQNYLADNVTRKEKKREAVKRMAMLKIKPFIIEKFIKEDCVYQSESPTGSLSTLNDEQKQKITQFEKEHKVLVYYVMCSNHVCGRVEDYLFVSDCRSEWEQEYEDIKIGQLHTYANNLDDSSCSEFGCIDFDYTPSGVLIRDFIDVDAVMLFEQQLAVAALVFQLKSSINFSERKVAPLISIVGTEGKIEYTVIYS